MPPQGYCDGTRKLILDLSISVYDGHASGDDGHRRDGEDRSAKCRHGVFCGRDEPNGSGGDDSCEDAPPHSSPS